MWNMMPSGREVVFLLIVVAIIGWAVISGLVWLAHLLLSHISFSFV